MQILTILSVLMAAGLSASCRSPGSSDLSTGPAPDFVTIPVQEPYPRSSGQPLNRSRGDTLTSLSPATSDQDDGLPVPGIISFAGWPRGRPEPLPAENWRCQDGMCGIGVDLANDSGSFYGVCHVTLTLTGSTGTRHQTPGKTIFPSPPRWNGNLGWAVQYVFGVESASAAYMQISCQDTETIRLTGQDGTGRAYPQKDQDTGRYYLSVIMPAGSCSDVAFYDENSVRIRGHTVKRLGQDAGGEKLYMVDFGETEFPGGGGLSLEERARECS